MSRDCIFCGIADGQAEASVVLDEDPVMAFMDIYPFRPGHVLVIPKGHAQYAHELEPPVRAALFEAATRIGQALRGSSIAAADVHFLINDGRAANQTVPHVHMHVVPRRRGDLPAVIAALAQRPAVTLLGAAPRERLDQQAATLAATLEK